MYEKIIQFCAILLCLGHYSLGLFTLGHNKDNNSYNWSEVRGAVEMTKQEFPANVTVFLSYAYNPFGPATVLQPNKTRNSPERSEDTGQEEGQERGHRRSKRGVFHLYNMVKCATGCNPITYKGYGCYCGFLGSGQPVDGIDRCCKYHDWCYDSAGCLPFFTYFMPYYWRCYHNRAFCALDHDEFGGPGSCAQRLCECDRVLSDCLSRYPCPSSRAVCYSSPWRLLQNKLMIL